MTESTDYEDARILEDIARFSAYDKSTERSVLVEAKKRLVFCKHNVQNREEKVDAAQDLLLKITTCLERIDRLLSGEPDTPSSRLGEIDPSQIDFNPSRDKIGGGKYGVVYRAVWNKTRVAVKMPKAEGLMTAKDIQMFRQEARIMARIRHKHTVQFYGGCFEPGSTMIVTELMNTDMGTLIHKRTPPLTIGQKLSLAYDSALGLSWLHNVSCILHRDLKPENILVDDHNVAHLTDFGFSQILKGETMDRGEVRGTPVYLAPEIILRKSFSFSSDVHSFGMVLFELFTGLTPFYDKLDNSDAFYRALCYDHERPHIRDFKDVPEGIKDLAERCWDKVPENRPPMKEVVECIANTIVDYAIPPKVSMPANKFWKHYFLNPFSPTVKWEDFTEAVLDNMKLTTIEEKNKVLEKLEVLKKALCQTTRENLTEPFVTMEKFNRYFLWFGTWFETPGMALLDEMVELFQQEWYMHELDSSTAGSFLSGREGGTFLVRLSLHSFGSPFSLSYVGVHAGEPFHTRVDRNEYDPNSSKRYLLRGQGYFRTIPELVQHLIGLGLFKKPCPPCPRKTPYDLYSVWKKD